MKSVAIWSVGLVTALCLASYAEAYTSKKKATAISVSTSTVTESKTLTATVVDQGSADTSSSLGFGSGGNTFRNSGKSIKVDVESNLADNKVIIYTDNLNASANPKFCENTEKGNDGGGLVGINTPTNEKACESTVPLLWAVVPKGVAPNPLSPLYTFTEATVGDDEVYITDLAHVATYVDAALPGASAAEKQKLDALPMKNCQTGAAVSNPDNTGSVDDPLRYPQSFGGPGVKSDLCNAGPQITIGGKTFLPCNTVPCDTTSPTNSKVTYAEELSKNIATVAFNFVGKTGLAPNLGTSDSSDSITITAPFYLPIAADFRTAPGADYATNRLFLELITQ